MTTLKDKVGRSTITNKKSVKGGDWRFRDGLNTGLSFRRLSFMSIMKLEVEGELFLTH